MNKTSVLLLCTGNSARSQMGEALLRHFAGDRHAVHSAGTEPKPIHPLTLEVLGELGIDTGPLHSKGIDTFMGKARAHHAIIVCEQAAQACPRIYPFAVETHYWPFEDPAAFEGARDEQIRKFREVRDLIAERLQSWVSASSARG